MLAIFDNNWTLDTERENEKPKKLNNVMDKFLVDQEDLSIKTTQEQNGKSATWKQKQNHFLFYHWNLLWIRNKKSALASLVHVGTPQKVDWKLESGSDTCTLHLEHFNSQKLSVDEEKKSFGNSSSCWLHNPTNTSIQYNAAIPIILTFIKQSICTVCCMLPNSRSIWY